MRQAIFVKKPDASLEENMDYVLSKIDYLLRKIENYDRAINEFAEIKSTIDEAAEHTRRSKDMVRETKDSIEINSNDIETVAKSVKNLSNWFNNDCDFIRKQIKDLDIRSFDEDEKLEILIDDLREEIQNDLDSYATLADLKEMESLLDGEVRFLKTCISNAHENNLILESNLKQLESDLQQSKDYSLSLKKDLCRFQNALVRKGVPVDIQ